MCASAGFERSYNVKIVHVFRAPIGGLFRHVRDLARGQAGLGHEVGIVCDSTTGGEYAQQLVENLRQYCKLGIERRPISRMPGLGDLAGARTVVGIARRWQPDVLHGHGAKGGAYARIAGSWLRKRSFYTPHGGSLHFEASKSMRLVFAITEKSLRNLGTGLCFVCNYERDRFDRMFGIAGKPHRVVYNGLWDDEFRTPQTDAAARDFLFVGEMRDYKGVDILLEALALIPGSTAALVGDGPSMAEYQALSARLGLSSRVAFKGRMPMAEAVKFGRIMVLPSRFESFPYVVLETAAAGLPLITSAVGGIPEVVPRQLLCDPLNAQELARHMRHLLEDRKGLLQSGKDYAAHIRKTCSAVEMARNITDFYATA
jgi:glycosyltransferase involved in cell wall biosynthesis